jgi:hypothetical protein
MEIPAGTGSYFKAFKDAVENGNRSTPANTVRAARTLTKPQQMSFIEKIIDFFKGGEKGHANAAHAARVEQKVEMLVFNICIADPDIPVVKHGHGIILSSFVELRDLAKDSARDQFSFDYQTVKGEDEDGHGISSISYQINIAGTTLLSATVDGADRDSVLAFNKALVDSGIVPSALSASPQSVAHADAMLLKQLEDTLPKQVLLDAAPGTASLARQFDAVNSQPRYADAPHAAVGEKVRILSEAFPSQQFSIDVRGDRDHYAVTMRTRGAKAEYTLQQAEIGAHSMEQAQFPTLLSSAIKQSVTNLMTESGAGLGDRASFIAGNAQTICDDAADRAKLMMEMKNPAYSSATFTGIRSNPDNRTFTAMFGDKSMVFSNRMSSSELRGAVLQTRLRAPFANLEVILSEHHGMAQDPMLRYLLNSTKQNYFGAVVMDDKERAAVHREIGDFVVQRTTLGEIWNLTSPDRLSPSVDEIPDDFVPPRAPVPPTVSLMIDPNFFV